jgi:iron complex outermembrane receptor protein
MRSPRARRIAAAALSISLSTLVSTPIWAQAAPPGGVPPAQPSGEQPEEIVVTGSYIKGTPEDSALPVDVTSLEDMKNVGAPSVAELIRNLAYTSGNLAETNQFGAGGGGQAQEGVLTVNLRGLGSARTLVLVNGRRLAPSDLVGTDLSVLPKSAIGRLEVLKDGAAALYGSDAIGGVANFITRENFEGFEISGSEQFVDGSSGDHEVSLIGGFGGESLHVMGAFEWSHRSELHFRERSWGLKDEPLNPQGGWSSIGNPARILPTSPTGTILGAGAPDPQCALLGGAVSGPACRFQYTYFDNITEDQDNFKGYAEANWEITENHKLHVEGLYGYMNMPDWKTSPSYPPQSLFGPDRFISPTHPGLIDFKAQNPTFFQPLFGIPAAAQGAFALNRSIGVAGYFGGPQTGKRKTEQIRVVAQLTGDITDAISYETALSYSSRERLLSGFDMFTERMAFALDGLGGPSCDPATGTPGAGGCLYYNPFSNAIPRSIVNGAVNPQFNPAVANAPELMRWLYGPSEGTTVNQLFVYDGVLSGQIPWFSLPGGEIGWAAGAQVREEWYDSSVIDEANLAINPCPFNNQASVTLGNISQTNFDNCQNGITTPTGPYAFLAGTYEQSEQRLIYGFFGELQLPFHDTLHAQFALRFENYGGSVGSTVDPKLSMEWQPLEWLKFRGSVATTFRGPPQSFLSGRVTSLQFVIPANAFKAVDTLGNPDLKPESALTSNVGTIIEWGGLYASLDYWRFNFEDPFQLESFGQIVTAYSDPAAGQPVVPFGPQGCRDGGVGAPLGSAGPITPICQGLRAHVFPTGTSAAALERVEVAWINGADLITSGIDFYLQYEFDDVFGGVLTLGSSGSYRLEYDSEDFYDRAGVPLAAGGDFNGEINDGNNPFQPLPALKTDVFAKFSLGEHTGTIVGHYTTDYIDRFPSTPRLAKIDNLFVVDMHYVVRLFDETTALSFSILNLTDENPPFASTDLNYDPFTADARGRMYKIGLTYSWQPK